MAHPFPSPAHIMRVPTQSLRGALPTTALLRRYSTQVPRYTSYPTAPQWRDDVDARVAAELFGSLKDSGRALSLYVHLPFCHKLCRYCGCNMMVTRNRALVERYLAALADEIHAVAQHTGGGQVVQIHWGGGTPTFLDCEQLTRVHHMLSTNFTILPGAEQSIEVHPPVTTAEQMVTLRQLGFNRVSMGVQDFDPGVQEAVNRIQPFEQTRDLISICRDVGFAGVNVDLMYGLPRQTVESFSRTLSQVAELRPDRIALFGYAHVPSLKPHQKLLEQFGLPDPTARLELFQMATGRLLQLGYQTVGLDHFALPHDELIIARREGRMQRNFMGYTTAANSDLLGFGASSISDIDGAYLQNVREVSPYIDACSDGQLPTQRGWLPTDDDHLRRAVLHQIFCNLKVHKPSFEAEHGVAFNTYFSDELARLVPLQEDGLVQLTDDAITVTPTGQLLLRNIAAVFDAYLNRPSERPVRYSQSI